VATKAAVAKLFTDLGIAVCQRWLREKDTGNEKCGGCFWGFYVRNHLIYR
jgi:hypothetical protein